MRTEQDAAYQRSLTLDLKKKETLQSLQASKIIYDQDQTKRLQSEIRAKRIKLAQERLKPELKLTTNQIDIEIASALTKFSFQFPKGKRSIRSFRTNVDSLQVQF